MTTSVFDQNTDTKTVDNTAPASVSPFDDKLKAIVNDQGEPKYKDVPSALDALAASQAHIKRLEDEAKIRLAEEARIREELAKAEALEDVVRRLQTNKELGKDVTPPNTGLSEDAIVQKLETILSQREANATAKLNMQSVSDTLSAKYGDKTAALVADKAKELSMSPQELGILSSKNPKLVLSLFGENFKPPVNPSTPSQSTPLNPVITEPELKRPEKSLLSGPAATDKNRAALMKEIRDKVYKKHGVEAA